MCAPNQRSFEWQSCSGLGVDVLEASRLQLLAALHLPPAAQSFNYSIMLTLAYTHTLTH